MKEMFAYQTRRTTAAGTATGTWWEHKDATGSMVRGRSSYAAVLAEAAERRERRGLV